MDKSDLTALLIVAVVLFMAMAILAIIFHHSYRNKCKDFEDLRRVYRNLKRDYDSQWTTQQASKNHLHNEAYAATSTYSDPQPSPEHTWTNEEVKSTAPPVKTEATTIGRAKAYFPLSNGGFFYEKNAMCESNSVYEAQEVAPHRYEFTIISAAKAKSWPITDAVSNVGNVLQQDAVDFKCIKKGEIVEHEDDNHQLYWEITRKTEIEFT